MVRSTEALEIPYARIQVISHGDSPCDTYAMVMSGMSSFWSFITAIMDGMCLRESFQSMHYMCFVNDANLEQPDLAQIS